MSSKRKRNLPSWMMQSDSSKKVATTKQTNGHVSDAQPAASPVQERFVVDNLSDDSNDEGNSHQEQNRKISSPGDFPPEDLKIEAEETLEETTQEINEDIAMSSEKANRVDSEDIATGSALSNDKTPDNSASSSTDCRQSCFYGSSCYRKNPQHRIDLAHPGDSDYKDQATTSNDQGGGTVDNRPLCQYGSACYRKNPQHRLDYRHDAPKKRKARPTEFQDLPSDNDGDFDGSISSDNYNPSESDDSFVTSDSMGSGNSDFKSDESTDEGKEEKAKKAKKQKKRRRKDSK